MKKKNRYIFFGIFSVLEGEENIYIYIYVFLGVSSSRKKRKKNLFKKKMVGLLPSSNYIVN